MPVKKFEAKSIKEALALVKNEFGPDAVILSAKDMSKSHGLVGDKSVQVTAAISAEQLRKKQEAELSLASSLKKTFQNSSALQQKQYIKQINQNNNSQVSSNEQISSAQQKIQQMYSNKRLSLIHI